MNVPIEIFSTCPQYQEHPDHYIEQIRNVSRWSEEAGFKGILVYSDNRQMDPWMVSQVIIEATCSLSPLIAIQPVYMHPFTVAKRVQSFGLMYGRQVYLNMVAGGFRNDLKALNDSTSHDRRYERLIEYTSILSGLLEDRKPVTFSGDFYTVTGLDLKPKPESSLLPGIFISGSSEAGLHAAQTLRATAIQYPNPSYEYKDKLEDNFLNYGIRIGIISRENSEEAWLTGFRRFPASREGQLAHELAIRTTDSVWYKRLSGLDSGPEPGTAGTDRNGDGHSTYWLHPFKNYKTMCPYLIGDYEEVSSELSRYMEIGYRTFILDIPPDREELVHTRKVFEMAKREISR